jgi:hypothetical protein
MNFEGAELDSHNSIAVCESCEFRKRLLRMFADKRQTVSSAIERRNTEPFRDELNFDRQVTPN